MVNQSFHNKIHNSIYLNINLDSNYNNNPNKYNGNQSSHHILKYFDHHIPLNLLQWIHHHILVSNHWLQLFQNILDIDYKLDMVQSHNQHNMENTILFCNHNIRHQFHHSHHHILLMNLLQLIHHHIFININHLLNSTHSSINNKFMINNLNILFNNH